MDILLGLSFLATHLVLMYSSKHSSRCVVCLVISIVMYHVMCPITRSHLTLYFVLSVSTLLLYWAWFVYLKYAMGESEASKEVNI